MKNQTWLILIILGCLFSPAVGALIGGLYVFNYATAVIFDMYRNRGFK